MRKTILLCALLLAGCAAQNPKPTPPAPPPAKDWTITVTFSYDFTNFAQCSATVTTGCISGFTWGYLQGSTPVPLKTSAVSACSGTTQPESCTDTVNSQLPIGSLTFFVEANYIDNTGAAGESAEATSATPTVVTAGAPASLTVAIK